MPHKLITYVESFMMLGEMLNVQKVTQPKSQLAKKVDWLKTLTRAILLFYFRVDFLVS
jgi:hypothetical protein